MAVSSADVVGRWVFSHEEAGARVFVPRARARPSRAPREAMDVNADGTFRSYEPGPADAPSAIPGRWTLAASGRFEATFSDGRPSLSFDVIAARPDALKLRAP